MRARIGRLRGFRLLLAACAPLAWLACGLEGVEIPDLDGPAGLGFNLRVSATPDIVLADGNSTSLVQGRLIGPDGSGVAGRQIAFSISNAEGQTADIGTLTGPSSIGTAVIAITNGQGIAQATYTAPPRMDANANREILITGRTVGDDANGQFSSFAVIGLRMPDPRLFPPNPDNDPPVCTFAIEAPNGFNVNQTIIFDSTSSDIDGEIIRYEWDFGNGTGGTSPDVATVYRTAGTYTVGHQVTDNNGAQSSCFAVLLIQ
jgi:PKD repeat protein